MLAALWLALIVVPAVVTAQLLADGGGTSRTAWVVGGWVGGYVAQMLVFRSISRTVPWPLGLGWLLASTVPWAADWTAPLSRWGVAVWAAVIIAYSAWLVTAVRRVDRLRGGNKYGSAVVIEVIRPTFTAVVTKDSTRRTLRIRVEPADGTTSYETQVAAAFTLGDVPEVGDRLAVRIDPADPMHVEINDDEPVERAYPVPEDLDAGAAEQLRRFATMRDRGDLTDAQFSEARNRLLNP